MASGAAASTIEQPPVIVEREVVREVPVAAPAPPAPAPPPPPREPYGAPWGGRTPLSRARA